MTSRKKRDSDSTNQENSSSFARRLPSEDMSSTSTSVPTILNSNQNSHRHTSTRQQLFFTLEIENATVTPDDLNDVLLREFKQLRLLLGAFQPAKKVPAKIPGAVAKVNEFITSLSSHLDLEDTQCHEMLQNCLRYEITSALSRLRLGWSGKDIAVEYDDQTRDLVTDFYFEERLGVIQVVTAIIKSAGNTSSQYNRQCSRVLPEILGDEVATPFVNRALDQLKVLMSKTVPPQFEFQHETALKFTKQYLREQKCLLELLFVLHYNHIECPPNRIVQVLKLFVSLNFGRGQPNESLYDSEAQLLNDTVTQLCLLFVLELMYLEELVLNDKMGIDLVESESESRVLAQFPDLILEITEVICYLKEKFRGQLLEINGPLLLAWASYLEQIRGMILESVQVTESYRKILVIIQRGTGAMLIPATFAASSDLLTTHLLSRAYNLNVWKFMIASFDLPCYNPEQSAFCVYYCSVIKGLMNLFQKSFSVHRLENFDDVTTLFSKIYTGQTDLALQFWEQDYESEFSRSVLDTAQQRFPLQFGNLVLLLASLTQKGTATYTAQYLHNIDGFTLVMNQKDFTKAYGTLDEAGVVKFEWNGTRGLILNASNEMNLWPSKGTEAYSVAKDDSIVKLQFSYSAWWLFCSMIDSFLRSDNPNTQSGASGVSGNAENVTHILTLINQVLKSAQTPLFDDFLAHLNAFPGFSVANATVTNSSKDFVSLVCRILVRCGTFTTPPFELLKQILDFLALVANYAPIIVWTQLNQTPLVPSGRNLNEKWLMRTVIPAELSRGHYEVLLAFLELVLLLVQNTGIFSLVDVRKSKKESSMAQHIEKIQVDVVTSFIAFIHTDVFPAHGAWRYKTIIAKYQIGDLCLQIYNCLLRNTASTELYELQNRIRQSFRNRSGLYCITPLIKSLAIDTKEIEAHYRQGMLDLARKLENVVLGAFSLTQKLVGRGDTITVLEAALLDCVFSETTISDSSLRKNVSETRLEGEEDNSELVYKIAMSIAYPYNNDIPIAAIKALTMMVKVAALWTPRPPSFVGYFGEKAKDMVTSLVELVSDTTVSLKLRVGVWNFMTETVNSQPGLVGLIISELKDISKILEKSFENDPQCYEAILKFFSALWKQEPMFRKSLGVFRTEAFWKQIGRGVKEVFGNQGENFRADICYSISAKANALKILAMEIFHRSVDSTTGEASLKLIPNDSVAILKSLLSNSSNGSPALKEMSTLEARTNEENMRTLEALGNEILGSGILRNFKVTRINYEFEYGDNYIIDLELLESKIDAESRQNPKFGRFLQMVKRTNRNWSSVDANMILIKAWTFLFQVLNSLFGAQVWEMVSVGKDTTELLELIKVIATNIGKERDSNGVVSLYRINMCDGLLSCVDAWVGSYVSKRGKVPEKVYGNAMELVMVLFEGFKTEGSIANGKPDNSVNEDSVGNAKLLTSILLLLKFIHTMFEDLSDHSNYSAVYKKLSNDFPSIVHVVCEGIQILSAKALSSSLSAAREQDLQLLLTVLNEMIRLSSAATFSRSGKQKVLVVSNFDSVIWLPILEQTRVFSSFLMLFAKEVANAVQISGFNGESSSCWNGTGLMHLFLALSSVPKAAEKLAVHGLLDVFSNNEVSPILAVGKVQPYTGPISQAKHMIGISSEVSGQASGERSAVHRIWCACVSIISQCLSHHHRASRNLQFGSSKTEPVLASSRQFLTGVAGFIGATSAQISAAVTRCSAIEDASTTIQLTIASLEEVEKITELYYEISFAEFFSGGEESDEVSALNMYGGRVQIGKRHSGSKVADRVSTSNKYPQQIGALLSNYVYLFTHPAVMKSRIVPITRDEKDRSSTEFMKTATDLMRRTVRNVINYFVLVTDSQFVISHPYAPAEWPFGNIVVSPTLSWNFAVDGGNIGGGNGGNEMDGIDGEEELAKAPVVSVGTLIEIFQHVLELFDVEYGKGASGIESAKILLEIGESTLLLVSTQMALFMNSPHVDVNRKHAAKNEVGNDVRSCVEQMRQKLTSLSGRKGGGSGGSSSSIGRGLIGQKNRGERENGLGLEKMLEFVNVVGKFVSERVFSEYEMGM
ncbi:hypothetical protein HK098_004537 [Nowakowskiella sp. JEL0407]|nr:hypothetical protein HK098_004537 [Nowakowskiella sp. JEL0407]